MSIETTAAKVSSEPVSRIVPQIPANNIHENAKGFCWREFLVRLPEGINFGDLVEPRIFKQIQATSRVSLRKFDRLVILAYDESWQAECIVAAASADAVNITKPQKIDLPAATEKMFETPEWRVKWVGNGYAVERKSDGTTFDDLYPTMELAERALLRKYPRRA